MRRKPGTLVPLELELLDAALELRREGTPEAHGFLLARTVGDQGHAKRLTGYGTLYKALDRLERAGHLESRWEDPQAAAEGGRPRRRFYRITILGEAAIAAERTRAESESVLRAQPSRRAAT